MIHEVEAIGAWTVEAAVIFQKNHPLPMAVTKDDPPGHSAECFLDQAGRDTHAVVFGDESPCFSQHLHRFGFEEADSGPFQDFEAGVVQFSALLRREPSEVWARKIGVIGTNAIQ
jgi:hypothetical protein